MPPKLTLEEIQDRFTKRGCELLSAQVQNCHSKVEYRCRCGKECTIIASE